MPNNTYAADGTWLGLVNGAARIFMPRLQDAITYAMMYGQCDLTNTQAVEYASQFPLTDNQNEPHELHREIIDCGDECDHTEEGSVCFTVVTEDDVPVEDIEELIDGFGMYQVWKNDNCKPKKKKAKK